MQAAADEIGGPLAPELRRNAAALVYNVGQLGLDMDAAIGVLADIDKLEDLAFNALDGYPAVVGTTLNRTQERNNQAALINFVRGLATVRFAARVGTVEYRDREQARANRGFVDRGAGPTRGRCEHPRISARCGACGPPWSSTCARNCCACRRSSWRRRPACSRLSRSAYDIYEDIGRAADIVGRIGAAATGLRAGQRRSRFRGSEPGEFAVPFEVAALSIRRGP